MDNRHSALVIIDPQKDFTSLSGAYARRHKGISQIRSARQQIAKLLASIPAHIPVIVVCSDYAPDQFGENLSLCIPGTEGHLPDLEIKHNYHPFIKTEHSAFSAPAFSRFLKEQNIHHLYLCGFLAEYCVLKTALNAVEKRYHVTLLTDCIGTGDDVQWRMEETMMRLKDKGVLVNNSGINDLIY